MAWLVMLALVVGAPSRVSAQSGTPEVGQGEVLRAKLLLLALSYDRNLASRAGSAVGIAVLYRADRAASVSAKDAMVSGLANLARHKIAGKPLQVKAVALSDAGALSRAIDREGFSALLAVKGLSIQDIRMITSVSRAKAIASLACERDQVVAGAAIGVVIQDGKPKLLVNLPASKKEKLNLSSAMLRAAEVIR
jgi:hypothetical protein